jgi:hypothetical protein
MTLNNYFELVRNLERKNIENKIIGKTLIWGVLNNINDHLDFYKPNYVKDLKKKENNRVFNYLEKLTTEKYEEISIQNLVVLYRKTTNKTTKKVLKINFIYDALNFYLAEEGEDKLNSCFEYCGSNIKLLGNLKIAREIRGIKKKKGKLEYMFHKSIHVNQEYEYLVKNFKKTLQKNYDIIFQ